MDISFDAATNYPSTGGTVDTHTFVHVVSGVGNIIFVGFMHYTDNSDIVDGVTYNGIAMERVATEATASTRAYLYMLRAPATGTHDVEVSLSTTRDIYGGACSYNATKQTGSADSSNTGTINGATSIAVSTTTVTDNCWIVGVYASQSGRGQTAGANTTQRLTNSSAVSMYDTNAAQTPAGSHTLNITLNSTDVGALIVASFEPNPANEQQSAAFLTI